MKIFKDVFSNDELASDSFPYVEEGDIVYKFTTKQIVRTEDAYNFDSSSTEQYEGTSETVNNLVNAHRLVETAFSDKKQYMSYMKGYMGKLKSHLEKTNPGRVAAFMKAAQAFVKDVLANFDDYKFYMGESNDPSAQIVLMKWSEDGQTPYVYVFKDGVVETKY
jgi:hypothetical protein